MDIHEMREKVKQTEDLQDWFYNNNCQESGQIDLCFEVLINELNRELVDLEEEIKKASTQP